MTVSPPSPSVAAPNDGKTVKAKKTAKKSEKPKRGFFVNEAVTADIVDEAVEKARMKKVLRILQVQVVVIAALALFLIEGVPLFQPIYFYYALNSSDADRHEARLVPLYMPNMTNQAIRSWATNSVTEIMTFGFGDYVSHLGAQRPRFTQEGWVGFVGAFEKMNLGQIFRERQLVLTTVPSDTAVISEQGPPKDNPQGYEWKVQLPVVMTYATNDNITTRSKAVILLTITRVPTLENPVGIAIKNWSVQ